MNLLRCLFASIALPAMIGCSDVRFDVPVGECLDKRSHEAFVGTWIVTMSKGAGEAEAEENIDVIDVIDVALMRDGRLAIGVLSWVEERQSFEGGTAAIAEAREVGGVCFLFFEHLPEPEADRAAGAEGREGKRQIPDGPKGRSFVRFERLNDSKYRLYEWDEAQVKEAVKDQKLDGQIIVRRAKGILPINFTDIVLSGRSEINVRALLRGASNS